MALTPFSHHSFTVSAHVVARAKTNINMIKDIDFFMARFSLVSLYSLLLFHRSLFIHLFIQFLNLVYVFLPSHNAFFGNGLEFYIYKNYSRDINSISKSLGQNFPVTNKRSFFSSYAIPLRTLTGPLRSSGLKSPLNSIHPIT